MEGQGGDFKLKKSHRDAGGLGGDSGQGPSDSGRESPRTGTLQARTFPKARGQGGWGHVHRQLLLGGSRLRRQNPHSLSTTLSRSFPPMVTIPS